MARIFTAESFWARVDKTDTCWVWTGSRTGTRSNYGVVRPNRQSVMVHRWAWEQDRGKIPDEMTLDHLCRNTLCVRLDHLEVTTRAENSSRTRFAKTHCKQGHEFTAENSEFTVGRRKCKKCRSVASKRYKAKKKEKV